MDIEEAIFQLLSTDQDILDLVGTRIFPTALPQIVEYPSIVYLLARLDKIPIMEFPGISALIKPRIRFFSVDIGVGNFARAKAVDTAINKLMQGFSGVVNGVQGSIKIQIITHHNSHSFFEATTQTHQIISDFDIGAYEERSSSPI